jgi:hypothetical protein
MKLFITLVIVLLTAVNGQMINLLAKIGAGDQRITKIVNNKKKIFIPINRITGIPVSPKADPNSALLMTPTPLPVSKGPLKGKQPPKPKYNFKSSPITIPPTIKTKLDQQVVAAKSKASQRAKTKAMQKASLKGGQKGINLPRTLPQPMPVKGMPIKGPQAARIPTKFIRMRSPPPTPIRKVVTTTVSTAFSTAAPPPLPPPPPPV